MLLQREAYRHMRPTQVEREVYCVTHLLRDLWPIQVQSEVYHVTLLVGTINNPIQIDEARFAGRRKYILIPIIERECAYGSVIHSDEWPAYSNLRAMGYQHSTVNHQQHYVDPVTGAHTQRSLLEAKAVPVSS